MTDFAEIEAELKKLYIAMISEQQTTAVDVARKLDQVRKDGCKELEEATRNGQERYERLLREYEKGAQDAVAKGENGRGAAEDVYRTGMEELQELQRGVQELTQKLCGQYQDAQKKANEETLASNEKAYQQYLNCIKQAWASLAEAG